jgi:hypothetical protein
MTNAQSKMSKEQKQNQYDYINEHYFPSQLIRDKESQNTYPDFDKMEEEQLCLWNRRMEGWENGEKNVYNFSTPDFKSGLLMHEDFFKETEENMVSSVVGIFGETRKSEWFKNFPTRHRKNREELNDSTKGIHIHLVEFADEELVRKFVNLVNYMIELAMSPKCDDAWGVSGTLYDDKTPQNTYFGGRLVRATGLYDKEEECLKLQYSLFTTKEYKRLYKMEQPRKCANCNKTTKEKGETQRCAGCDSVRYCGEECQKQAWEAHKPICKAIQPIHRKALRITKENLEKID